MLRCSGLYFWFVLLLFNGHIDSQVRYEETPVLRDAYELILLLKLDSARRLLSDYRTEDPNNLLVETVDSYIDFLRSFINEDRSSLEEFESLKNKRLLRIRNNFVHAPYYYFAQAEIHLQWSLARAKHGEYLRAAWDLNKAYKLLMKCKRAFPDFELADKSVAVIHSLVGSIKGLRRSLIHIFTSLDGSVKLGNQEMERVYTWSASKKTLWHPEVTIIRALLYRYVNHDLDGAQEVLYSLLPKYRRSPIVRFLLGSVSAELGDARQAIEHWSWSPELDQMPMYYLDLLKGVALLNELNPEANRYLLSYVNHHPGSHYQKEARQKLAWYALVLENDTMGYQYWMRRCMAEGDAEMGEDQQALHEAKSRVIPNQSLLRARLLCDGGLQDLALQELLSIDDEGLNERDLLEYRYRKARILHKSEQVDEAMIAYLDVVESGQGDARYYACNAALQLAELMTSKGDLVASKSFYKLCLDIHPDEFRSSLHQKARLGLEKLNIE